ncbi:hypothetical protein [Nitrosospira multiformis]|nr:hypothetical protein [Nitrosospira multiformis]
MNGRLGSARAWLSPHLKRHCPKGMALDYRLSYSSDGGKTVISYNLL